MDLVLALLAGLALPLVVMAATVVVLKGKFLMFAGGFVLMLLIGLGASGPAGPSRVAGLGAIGVVLWAVGASRLALPGSTWARWLYGDSKMAMARARYPPLAATQIDQLQHRSGQRPLDTREPGRGTSDPTELASRPSTPTPDSPADSGGSMAGARPDRASVPPREAMLAFWLLIAATVVGWLGGGFAMPLFGGLVLPHAALARAGRRSSRTVAVAAMGLGLITDVILLVLASVTVAAIVTMMLAITSALAAMALLYRPAVSTYLTTRDRQVGDGAAGTS